MTNLTRLLFLTLVIPSTAYGFEVTSEKYNLTTSKVARIEGPVNGTTLERFGRDMIRTADLPGDRLVVIDSEGGDTEIGEEMWLMLASERHMSGGKVICIVKGMAASMAFNLLTRCDVRLGTEDSKYVFHHVKFFTPGVARNKPLLSRTDLLQMAEELRKSNVKYDTPNAAALSMPMPEYQRYALKDDHEWSSVTLLSRGYLAAIVQIKE